MLVFVIPFRDVGTTDDWPGLCRLLQRTLDSATGQRDPGRRVVVVGHTPPDGIRWPAGCEFLGVRFPPPSVDRDTTAEQRVWRMHTDKGRKMLHGLAVACDVPDSFVMFLDADDLVSNRLAGFAAAHPDANGWYFERGYRLDEYPRPALYWRRRFYHECGSSHVIRSSAAPFPDRLDDTLDLSDYHVRRYVTHAYIRDDLAKRGTPLAPLPFYGAIYTFNRRNFFATTHRQPDRVWRQCLRQLIKRRPITRALRREFGLRTTNRPAGAS